MASISCPSYSPHSTPPGCHPWCGPTPSPSPTDPPPRTTGCVRTTNASMRNGTWGRAGVSSTVVPRAPTPRATNACPARRVSTKTDPDRRSVSFAGRGRGRCSGSTPRKGLRSARGAPPTAATATGSRGRTGPLPAVVISRATPRTTAFVSRGTTGSLGRCAKNVLQARRAATVPTLFPATRPTPMCTTSPGTPATSKLCSTQWSATPTATPAPSVTRARWYLWS
mmetsp:Transcript_70103/g.164954  ORF Transcript_70103/g.164954 Transcript_70103/m.164954 type:complete len:225 (-) Transcript_70103:172-846(-)